MEDLKTPVKKGKKTTVIAAVAVLVLFMAAVAYYESNLPTTTTNSTPSFQFAYSLTNKTNSLDLVPNASAFTINYTNSLDVAPGALSVVNSITMLYSQPIMQIPFSPPIPLNYDLIIPPDLMNYSAPLSMLTSIVEFGSNASAESGVYSYNIPSYVCNRTRSLNPYTTATVPNSTPGSMLITVTCRNIEIDNQKAVLVETGPTYTNTISTSVISNYGRFMLTVTAYGIRGKYNINYTIDTAKNVFAKLIGFS